jgi:hypothetical protein
MEPNSYTANMCEEVIVRFLPSTAQRPDRVKLSYPARGRTRTFEYDSAFTSTEQQALSALGCWNVGVLAIISRGVNEPITFAVPREYLQQLAVFFGIKASK